MPVNPFESGERKVIPAVLVYVRNAGKILMIHRNTGGKSGSPDYHAGKWNGLGGKLELNESPIEAARREVREEAGIELPEGSLTSLGTLQFPNFKAHKNEDWLVWVFVALSPGDVADSGDQEHSFHSSSDEGDLHWIPADAVQELNLWKGDREFIPFVLARKPFMGTIWYQGEDVVRSWIQPL